jgi:hypothetical protein
VKLRLGLQVILANTALSCLCAWVSYVSLTYANIAQASSWSVVRSKLEPKMYTYTCDCIVTPGTAAACAIAAGALQVDVDCRITRVH